MTTTIATRIYRRIVAANLRGIRTIIVHRQERRWRRGKLRALRQRSRE